MFFFSHKIFLKILEAQTIDELLCQAAVKEGKG